MKDKADKIIDELAALLALALPYIEDAAADDHNDAAGKKRIAKLARDARWAIEHYG